jgi:hypothetical protein
MLTLTLAVGLLAAPEPQAGPPKGWTIEVRGYTYHQDDVLQLLIKGWTIEKGGHTYHLKQLQRRKEFIVEFQWKPQAEPVEGRYQPVKAQYHDDLSAFLKRLRVQVEPVKAFYVDDLPALFKSPKQQKP